MNPNDKIFQIIQRHTGSLLTAIFIKDNKLTYDRGILRAVNALSIHMDSEVTYFRGLEIPFTEINQPKLLNLYNTNKIDLLKPNKNTTLGVLLQEKNLKKTIIHHFKENLNSELGFVAFFDDKISLVHGKFRDMGIMGVTVALPPFYNKDLLLKYNSVYNVYNSELKDLMTV